ncbi:alpha-L-fucosidase [Nocardia sp. NPDC127579]|uniref:alpha-L-fucosidase n=1 Tax=Nocardia sp. NPDC127579 TaxID=3345402 RepID=UPI0036404821
MTSGSRVRRLARIALRAGIAALALGVLAAAVLGIGSWRWARIDDAKAAMTTTGPYDSTLDSLRKHPLPAWFQDAKFGIMLHWGPYSVPGFAPTGRTFTETVVGDYDHALTRSPYAEDYANQIKDPDSPAAAYHRATYGAADYADIARKFEAELAGWDPDAWAESFRAAGASYVVLTAKYADGYALWPSAVHNPHAPDFRSKRDLVGELAAAVRARGMKFGLYYSGGVDWTFQPRVVNTLGDYLFLPYGADYADYAEAQVRELVQRYRPDILWNDIGWPTGQQRLNALFADYYNTVPEGVVNDRWQTASFRKQIMGWQPLRWGFDRFMEWVVSRPGGADRLATPPAVPHSDFRTPEYTGFDTVQDTFWQQDRGIGGSFGYNRQETDADYARPADLLADLAEAAANNGALLLNVGPSGGSGVIVPEQQARLEAIGAWLAVNREAVDGTRPWQTSTASAADGTRVVFTRRGSEIYLIVLGCPTGPVTVRGVALAGTARLLGATGTVTLTRQGPDTVLDAPFTGEFGPVVRIG